MFDSFYSCFSLKQNTFSLQRDSLFGHTHNRITIFTKICNKSKIPISKSQSPFSVTSIKFKLCLITFEMGASKQFTC